MCRWFHVVKLDSGGELYSSFQRILQIQVIKYLIWIVHNSEFKIVLWEYSAKFLGQLFKRKLRRKTWFKKQIIINELKPTDKQVCFFS